MYVFYAVHSHWLESFVYWYAHIFLSMFFIEPTVQVFNIDTVYSLNRHSTHEWIRFGSIVWCFLFIQSISLWHRLLSHLFCKCDQRNYQIHLLWHLPKNILKNKLKWKLFSYEFLVFVWDVICLHLRDLSTFSLNNNRWNFYIFCSNVLFHISIPNKTVSI